MKRIAMVLAPLTVFLVGCGDPAADPNIDHVDRAEVFVVRVDGDTDKQIFRFTTPDGMPCLSNWDGALTCDWSKSSTMGGIR